MKVEQAQLSKGVTGPGFFALAFGTIVGSAWMVLMGDWVAPAGPGGAALAFAVMALLMIPIAGAYAELSARVPRAGAEFVFIERSFGARWGFLTGWFLTLYYVGIAAFESLAFAWFLENLVPALRSTPVLYTLLGKGITLLDVSVGLVGICAITLVNSQNTRLALAVQKLITFTFLGATILLVGLAWLSGDKANWQPLFQSAQDRSFLGGFSVALATAGMWLSGFQSAAAAVEERSPNTSFRTVARCMMGAVAVAAAIYALAILGTASLIPWHGLIGGELPVEAAFGQVLPNSGVSSAICLIAMAAIAKTWNAMHLGATRLILAQARSGFLPGPLATIDPKSGTPRNAAILVGACTFIGVIAGRGAISPIISMSTMCTTGIAVFALCALAKMRSGDVEGVSPAYVLPGGKLVLGAMIVGAAIVAAAAVAAPFGMAAGMPVEILILLGWMALAIAILLLRRATPSVPTVKVVS